MASNYLDPWGYGGLSSTGQGMNEAWQQPQFSSAGQGINEANWPGGFSSAGQGMNEAAPQFSNSFSSTGQGLGSPMGSPTMGQGGYGVNFNQPGMSAPPPVAGSAPYAGQMGAGGWTPFMGNMAQSGTGTGVSTADMLARNPGLAGQTGALDVGYNQGAYQQQGVADGMAGIPGFENLHKPGNGMGMMGGGAAAANPGINWQDPAKQAAIRSAFNDPNNDPAKISQAMRQWGVSNSDAMGAMGWDQGKFDNYFSPVFGQKPGVMGMGTPGMNSAGQGMDESGRGGFGGGMVGGMPGGGGGFFGRGGGQYGGYDSGSAANPNLSAQADEIARRTQQGLGQAFNQIKGHAVGVGGLGGSRQGVAEGQATGQAMDSLQGNLANLFGNQWNQDQSRGLQKYGIDQQTGLGWGGLDNQRYGMNLQDRLGWGGLANQRYGMDQNYDINSQQTRNNFYTQNRQLDQSGARLGMDMYGAGNNGQWDALKNASSIYSPYSGLGTTSQGGQSGNWQSILAGLGSGLQFGNNMGWFK